MYDRYVPRDEFPWVTVIIVSLLSIIILFQIIKYAVYSGITKATDSELKREKAILDIRLGNGQITREEYDKRIQQMPARIVYYN